MSDDYVQAVEQVKWGWMLWAMFVLPAGIIWCGAAVRFCFGWDRSFMAGFSFYVAACGVFWVLRVVHVEAIQNTKADHMVSQAEMMDWSSDVWRLYGPIIAVPAAGMYCALHHAASRIILTLACRLWDHQGNRRRLPRGT